MTQTEALHAELAALRHRLDTLEDVNAIRKLHFAYGYYIDYCMYDEVISLFPEDGEVVFLSGIYKGHAGIARLYKTWFQNFFTGGRAGPIFGTLLDHFQMQDIIDVAPDRASAKGRFRTLLAGGNHVSRPDKPEGLPLQFWEAGLYENDYARVDGVWKIRRLDYAVQWQADYETGWGNTASHLQPATVCYPENPVGPDVLLPARRAVWPGREPFAFHYSHPVVPAG